MCTVSYLPLEKGYLLTSNRDEAPSRNTVEIEQRKNLIFPKDPQSSGTWIAMNNQGNTACLLNGAFEQFVPRANYRHSRGRIILDYFAQSSFEVFRKDYDLENIAPFTLVVVENHRLFTLVWDGKEKHLKELDDQKAWIWSSATLYEEATRNWRATLFQNWLAKNINYERENIVYFHRFGTTDDENGFVMNRKNIVKTLSISNVWTNGIFSEFQYQDLSKEQVSTHQFLLKT